MLDPKLAFALASLEHAKAIEQMRHSASEDLERKLGPGHWSGGSRLASIRERIKLADPRLLKNKTLYVALLDGIAVGSVGVGTALPGFWKKEYWQNPNARALGVFDLVVTPEFQGRSIGRFMMHHTERLAQEHSLQFVRLDAYASNPLSTGFYRHIGYEERTTINLRGCELVLFEKHVS